jgi:hypothetical protein
MYSFYLTAHLNKCTVKPAPNLNDQIKDAVNALKEAHPYARPSYQVLRLETI